jgi:hypothetical protein
MENVTPIEAGGGGIENATVTGMARASEATKPPIHR